MRLWSEDLSQMFAENMTRVVYGRDVELIGVRLQPHDQPFEDFRLSLSLWGGQLAQRLVPFKAKVSISVTAPTQPFPMAAADGMAVGHWPVHHQRSMATICVLVPRRLSEAARKELWRSPEQYVP